MDSRYRSIVECTLLCAVAFSVHAQIPEVVSPGAMDHVAKIERRCPSFSWGETPGVDHYQIEVYQVPSEMGPENVELKTAERLLQKRVFQTQVSGGATSWTPNLEQCLTPGESYIWFVRSIFRDKYGEAEKESEWSDGLFFSISTSPSAEEVTAALDVLQRHAAVRDTRDTGQPSAGSHFIDQVGPSTATDTRNSQKAMGKGVASATRPQLAELPQRSIPDAIPAMDHVPAALASQSVTSAKSAIKGHVDDPGVESYGVVGISESPDGAGVAAANMGGGPDLVLDGSADFLADTMLSESGIDRPSTSAQTFNIQNSVGAGMTLLVDGSEVVTTVTDKDTLGALLCAVGSMPRWNGFNWACVQGSLITSITAGSGLTGGGTVGGVSLNVGTAQITAAHLAANSVGASELAINSVHSSDIVDGTITYADTNTDSVQRRVTGSCSVGSSIASISATGTVSCYTDKYLSVVVGDELIAASYNGGDVHDYWYYGPSGTHLCFLSFVQLRDVDGGGEDAYCYVYPDSANNRWALRAHSETGDDADAMCRARCYTFHY